MSVYPTIIRTDKPHYPLGDEEWRKRYVGSCDYNRNILLDFYFDQDTYHWVETSDAQGRGVLMSPRNSSKFKIRDNHFLQPYVDAILKHNPYQANLLINID